MSRVSWSQSLRNSRARVSLLKQMRNSQTLGRFLHHRLLDHKGHLIWMKIVLMMKRMTRRMKKEIKKGNRGGVVSASVKLQLMMKMK